MQIDKGIKFAPELMPDGIHLHQNLMFCVRDADITRVRKALRERADRICADDPIAASAEHQQRCHDILAIAFSPHPADGAKRGTKPAEGRAIDAQKWLL